MKTKFFFAAMAAIAIIGCNKEVAETPAIADGEAAFLKVNLKAAGSITRADAEPGSFVYGEDNENVVGSILFFFFDENGAAYKVQGADNYVGDYIVAEDPGMSAGDVPNVEEISNAILVIKKSKVAPPTQMVALVNAPESFRKSMSLSQLEAEIVKAYATEEGFIMSNSVYMDEANGLKVVTAPIAAENIFTTTDKDVTALEPGEVIADASGITPVDIYVERVAAKVEVSLNDKYDTGAQANGQKVYAKVLGWNITNTVDEAYMVKAINTAWTEVGFTPWNSPAFHRSYWAATTAVPSHNHTFDALTKHTAEVDYYLENTLPAADENSVTPGQGNQTPQLIVAAQLVDENNNPVAFGKWYNVDYTVDGVKTAMASSIASKLYVADEENENKWRKATVADFEFEQVAETTEDNRYEVKIVAESGKVYYNPATATATTAPTAYTTAEVEAILASVDPAQIWASGYAYYYTNIKHFGDATGMVRNHVYKVNIEAIKGLGTPVYNPAHIITPELPDEQEALNLSARINVLAWHLVANDVTLGN